MGIGLTLENTRDPIAKHSWNCATPTGTYLPLPNTTQRNNAAFLGERDGGSLTWQDFSANQSSRPWTAPILRCTSRGMHHQHHNAPSGTERSNQHGLTDRIC
jgi:hypothetical protein